MLRKIEGVTPAKRKQFRIDERKRLQRLEEEEMAEEIIETEEALKCKLRKEM